MLKRFSKKQWISLGLSGVILLVSAAVIWGAWRVSQSPIPIDKPAEVYLAAVASPASSGQITYTVSGYERISSGTVNLSEIFTQTITYTNRNTQALKAQVEETRTMGEFEIVSTDFYADGKEYLTIQNAHFQSDTTAEDFTGKYAPFVLIDPALYSQISGYTLGKESTIQFSGPLGGEKWACPDGVQFLSGTGTVLLDKNGTLKESTYSLSYEENGVTVIAEYTATLSEGSMKDIRIPDSNLYTPVEATEPLYLLEKACGYLLNAPAIHATYQDSMAWEAFGDQRSQSIILKTETDEHWSAQVDTTISASNASQGNVTTSTTKSERFSGGKYTVTSEGNVTENPEVDLKTMQEYSGNLLTGTIIFPSNIASLKLEIQDGVYRITFEGTNDFAKLLAREACITMYNTADILQEMPVNESVTCYLNIEMNTGFPVASGFYYEGTYTRSDLPYKLTFKADQNYCLPNAE